MAALGLFLAAPALAEGVDWAAAGASYQAGKAGPERPASEAEFGQCSAFWGAWVDEALNRKRLPAEAAAALGDDLAGPKARMHALEWLLFMDGSAEAEAAYQAAEPEARAGVARALAGDGQLLQGYLGVLGACARPPYE